MNLWNHGCLVETARLVQNMITLFIRNTKCYETVGIYRQWVFFLNGDKYVYLAPVLRANQATQREGRGKVSVSDKSTKLASTYTCPGDLDLCGEQTQLTGRPSLSLPPPLAALNDSSQNLL